MDGEETAPPLVRYCLESWRTMNPQWTVRVLNSADLVTYCDISYIPKNKRVQLHIDALKLELLRNFGGIWVDATCLCDEPLDNWIFDHLASGFFAFSSPGPDRPLSNWALASIPHGYLISAWRKIVFDYWTGGYYSNHIGPNGRYDQFIYHYLFDWLIFANRESRVKWSKTQSLPAVPAHALQKYLKSESPAQGVEVRARHALESKNVPMHKLDWRIEDGAIKLMRSIKKLA